MDLPPELVDSIIDLCHDDKKTLGQCGLVCRAWLPRTRHNLFRSIHLYPSNVSAFLDILTAPHAPHSLIASVREVFATLHSFALAAPEHVCALDKAISLVVAAGIQMLSLDMGHLFKPCMAGFSSWCGNSSRNEISNLDIVHTTFDSSFKFTTWLSTWSALKSLTLKQVRIRDLHPPQCHPKLPSITTLSLDNVKSTSNLGGSLSFLLEELAPSLEHLHLRGCVVLSECISLSYTAHRSLIFGSGPGVSAPLNLLDPGQLPLFRCVNREHPAHAIARDPSSRASDPQIAPPRFLSQFSTSNRA